MKKRMIILVVVLLFGMVMAACGSNDLTKNYTTLAEDFTTTLYGEDYDGAMTYIDETMHESITTDALTKIVTETTSTYGAFQEVTDTEEISMSDYLDAMGVSDAAALDGLDCTVVAVTVSLESSEMYLYLVFDTADREIVGINVYGEEDKDGSETALTEDEMRSTARTFLDAVFSGDFDTAYDMMSTTLQGEMTAEDLDALMAESTSLYGDFDEVGQILIDGDDVIAYVAFEESEINAYLTFDSDGTVASFYTDTPH